MTKPPNKIDSEFRRNAAVQSAITLKALLEEAAKSRFLLGSHTKARLRQSVSLGKQWHLVNTSLLNPDVHLKHSEALNERYIRHWNNLSQSLLNKRAKQSLAPALNDNNIAASSLRFLTLIHSMEVVSFSSGFHAAQRLIADLKLTLKKARGISCLGAIEVEVVSMKLMRRLKELTQADDSETRKLDVCEILLKNNPRNALHLNDESFLLVHFHGVVSAKKEVLFDQLNEVLKANATWKVAPRQIELKKLSESYAGKSKSVEENLKHIARYITKGGNDWYGGEAYLRYKVGFDNKMPLSQDEWEALNWRNNEALRNEHKSEGIIDMLSLTHDEILTLALTIDSLMGLDSKRTGYQVKIGKW